MYIFQSFSVLSVLRDPVLSRSINPQIGGGIRGDSVWERLGGHFQPVSVFT